MTDENIERVLFNMDLEYSLMRARIDAKMKDWKLEQANALMTEVKEEHDTE